MPGIVVTPDANLLAASGEKGNRPYDLFMADFNPNEPGHTEPGERYLEEMPDGSFAVTEGGRPTFSA
jgi:hypothetical protein